MKPDNTLELRIRLKIGLLFLIVILYVVGVYFYSHNLKKNIDEQKKEMSESYKVQSQSEKLVYNVQEVQSILNELLVSHSTSQQALLDSLSSTISEQISFLSQHISETSTDELLASIDSLLNKKKEIVNTLNQRLRQRNPVQDIEDKIVSYEEIVKDSVIITILKDTTVVIKEIEGRRNIWGRLRDLVKSRPQQDSIIQISETEKEIITTSRVDTVISSDLKSATKEASVSYSSQITSIEKQVRELILSDQNISLQISKLLSEFHYQTTQITQKGILKSELLIQRIFSFAILIGALSLIIILIIIIFIASDLNKGRKARIALAEEKELTEKLMKSRHKLLLSISHDIKTPLSSIMGYLEIWNQSEVEGSKIKQLKSAQNSAQHILSMLTNLLEFSRLEQNKAVLHNSIFNLSETMNEIIEMLLPLTDETKLKVELKFIPGDSFWIKTDYTILKQILINVISNALKYTSHGSVEIKAEYNKGLIFTIEDTGTGMTDSELKEIFKPFSRASSLSTTEGSGFGMYVTKGLIQALNGSINIESEKERGTRVRITIPIHPLENIKMERGEPSEKSNIYNRILILEDDIPLGRMITEYLNQKGYIADLSSNPEEINNSIEKISDYEIVFTDMEMTYINGNQSLLRIREKNTEIPVWLMTANDDYTNERALSEGFNGLIKKPVQLANVINILSEQKDNYTKEYKPISSFSSLTEFLGDDEESIKSILSTFVTSVYKDIEKLTKEIELSNFEGAQQICHKMHPFISQMGAEYLCGVLLKMDSLRGKGYSSFPEWKSELQKSVNDIKAYADKIKEEYNLERFDSN